MDFALFILLNAILLIRPEELYPEIAGLRLYLIVIVVSLIVALPKLLRLLAPGNLERNPITVCVLGLLGAAAVSQLAHGRLDVVEEFVPEFAKVIAYYLLLVAVVDTPRRFKMFLGFQVAFICVVAALGVLQYHEYVEFEAIKPLVQRSSDLETGEDIEQLRMVSSGIFNDPNDLCLILVFGSLCCLYQAERTTNWLLKSLWVLPIGLFGYSLILTQSRGGLLGMIAGFAALIYAKFGWKRALPIIVIGAPLAVLGVGGRQAEMTGDTAHERIMIWADGLNELFGSPYYVLTGIGVGEYNDVAGHVAHNSFVHAFVEMGLVGGTLFLGAFIMSVWMLLTWKRLDKNPGISELTAAWPYVLAVVVGYCAGVYSLSRNYVAPTYICLGIATAFLGLTVRKMPPQFSVSFPWAGRLIVTGIGGLIFLKFFTQFAPALGL